MADSSAPPNGAPAPAAETVVVEKDEVQVTPQSPVTTTETVTAATPAPAPAPAAVPAHGAGQSNLAPPIDYSNLGGSTTKPAVGGVASSAVEVHPQPGEEKVDVVERDHVVQLMTGTNEVPPTSSHVHEEVKTVTKEPVPLEVPAHELAVRDHPLQVTDALESPKDSAVEVPPGDAAPAPALAPAPDAADPISSEDAAPKPAVEASPVQLHPEAEVPKKKIVAVEHDPVPPGEAVRPPTGPSDVDGRGAVASAPPPVSKPVVPAAESHLAEHPATDTDTDHVLPLGEQVHPVHQAAALQDAPDALVNAQVEKHKADMRAVRGEEPQGTVVPGMEDDKLWTMVRRFDAQILHTLTPPTNLPKGEPDLRPSTLPAIPFESDTLKSNFMRVYATLGIWTIYGAREAMRLMSWEPEHRRRTRIWCIAYFVCAALRMVLPAFFIMVAALVAYPKSRHILFPPVEPPVGVPPSATDPLNRKGDESTIAGVDHPIEHRSRSEQIEEQAWEFTNLVQRFGARVVVGGKAGGRQGNAEVGKKRHVEEADDDSDDDSELDDEEQELHEVAQQDGLGAAAHKERKEKKMSDRKRRKQQAKEAKVKRDAMIGNAAKTSQDILGAIADFAEIFANTVSPPKPYPQYHARETIATQILLPLAIVFAIMPAKYWGLLVSFGFGIAFFAQPLLIQGFELFQEKVPDWKERINPRNNLLSHVPTNAQVVLHIVRIAERHYTPFPLPPGAPTAAHMKSAVASGGFDEDEMSGAGFSAADTNQHSVEAGPLANQQEDEDEDEEDHEGNRAKKAGAQGKLVGALRKVAKKAAVFRGDVHVEGDETTKQKVGNKIDRLLHHSRAKDEMVPHSFPAKFEGTSGHILVKHSPSTTAATIAFVPLKASFQHPTFEYPIEDIVELKKHGVWIGRSVLGWAANISLEGMGLDLRFKPLEQRWAEAAKGGLGKGEKPHNELTDGETLTFSHVGRRDELFRRLLGISNAKWEVL